MCHKCVNTNSRWKLQKNVCKACSSSTSSTLPSKHGVRKMFLFSKSPVYFVISVHLSFVLSVFFARYCVIISSYVVMLFADFSLWNVCFIALGKTLCDNAFTRVMFTGCLIGRILYDLIQNIAFLYNNSDEISGYHCLPITVANPNKA